MPGFNGTGPRGMGPMTGGGRGFCSPWGRGAGMPAYGAYPRQSFGVPYYGAGPAAPQMTREQELDFLKGQAQELRNQIEQIESRINQMGNG